MGADQFRNAEAVVGVGAGRQLLATELDAIALRIAVMELLNDPAAAASAGRVKDEIASMPDARLALSALEQL
jgi:UDP:flavonoid glycosyltransferase YjiC (YdhE family)